MLRDTGRTVASIAQDVGYDSEAAFPRAFKKRVGVPPARWRRYESRPGQRLANWELSWTGRVIG
ncbi:MAG: helix-turn-helix domain-containing protein [Gammaproteobacteria bacterium]